MSSFVDLLALLRPFGDAAEEAGYEVEIRVRETGGHNEKITYRTGSYSDPPAPPAEDG